MSALDALRDQATHDAMTRLWNHSAILNLMHGELARADHQRTPISIILADLDCFKSVNDTYGHQAGDLVLREVAQRMRVVMEPYNQIGRYGGEEFVIILPGCDLLAAQKHAERLRHAIAAEAVPLETTHLPVTISLGVPGIEGGRTVEAGALIKAADMALYRAKHGGRNRVETAGAEELVERPPRIDGLPIGRYGAFVPAA